MLNKIFDENATPSAPPAYQKTISYISHPMYTNENSNQIHNNDPPPYFPRPNPEQNWQNKSKANERGASQTRKGRHYIFFIIKLIKNNENFSYEYKFKC